MIPRAELLSVGPYPALVAGSGRPLVYLAGLFPKTGVTSMRKMHEATLSGYTSRRRVHYINRRPHLPASMTIGELAAEHADAIRATFGQPVDVLGLSTGGSIAQQLAADHPDTVRRLALLSTGCRLSPELRASMRRIAARVQHGNPRRALALCAGELLPGLPWALPAALAAALLGPLLLSPSDLADFTATIVAEDPFDLSTCARPIAAPTLLVGGEKDVHYSVELLRETASLIPDCALRIEPGQGHVSVTAQPAVHRAILDHLDGR
jgi:pimeloyl-ACP methyl ester carboxylesterase